MPFAVADTLEAHIADILNAAQSWGGAIVTGVTSPSAITNARREASYELLRAISKNPSHGYFGELSQLVAVFHNQFLPPHDGEIGIPKIVPFEGAAARDGIPATAQQIDSFRHNPESYTGALDGIVIAHDQPNANKIEGAILTTSLNAGGADYAIGDTGTINAGDGLATYEVLTVDGSGAVLTFDLINRGSGYDVGEGVATATAGVQPGVGVGFLVNVLTIGSNGTGKQSPISCRFNVDSSYFKFTGLNAQIPMMLVDDTMADSKLPLSVSPAVVKLAIPKLVKPGSPVAQIAGGYAADGKQDLAEVVAGAMSVRPVRAVPDVVAALNLK